MKTEHMKTIPLRSWCRVAAVKNIDLWPILNELGYVVYTTRFKSDLDVIIRTGYCYNCRSRLPLRCDGASGKNPRWYSKICKCSEDGKKAITLQKLKTFLSSEDAENTLKLYNLSKTKGFKNREIYWINNGLDETQATESSRNIQISRSSISAEKNRGKLDVTPAQIAFWTKRGFSEKEAEKKIFNNQSRSMAFYQKKYGIIDGYDRWLSRQNKWKKSFLKAKLLDPTIHERQVVPLGKASKESLRVLLPLAIFLEEHNINDIFFGYDGRKEWWMRSDDAFYMYDFAVPSLNIIIEYHGGAFHPNKSEMSDDVWKNWRCARSGKNADSAYMKDLIKKDLAISKGFKYIEIWSTETTESAIDRCKKILLELMK